MRIAVNALPINNFSGRRVLLGHLRNLAEAGIGLHTFHVLHHANNHDLCRHLGSNVEWIDCRGVGMHWLGRLQWESLHMRRQLRALRADCLISTSGALVPFAGIPQWVWAQNPWCFFPEFHFSAANRLKGRLQRAGYRAAQRHAQAMFYLSDFMSRCYVQNAGGPPHHGATTYVGVDEEVFASACAPLVFAERPLEIVTVSVMTPHKAVEDVIDALALLHQRGTKTRLALVGPWSDTAYRQNIEARVTRLGLSDFIDITGEVEQGALMAHYRRARVFCLLSRCESFGIPAVEAQAFGTPSVVADACAPPEVAGPGGRVVAPGDIEAAADALEALLLDPEQWRAASQAALVNVERFRWQRVTQPMIDWMDRQAGGVQTSTSSPQSA